MLFFSSISDLSALYICDIILNTYLPILVSHKSSMADSLACQSRVHVCSSLQGGYFFSHLDSCLTLPKMGIRTCLASKGSQHDTGHMIGTYLVLVSLNKYWALAIDQILLMAGNKFFVHLTTQEHLQVQSHICINNLFCWVPGFLLLFK